MRRTKAHRNQFFTTIIPKSVPIVRRSDSGVNRNCAEDVLLQSKAGPSGHPLRASAHPSSDDGGPEGALSEGKRRWGDCHTPMASPSRVNSSMTVNTFIGLRSAPRLEASTCGTRNPPNRHLKAAASVDTYGSQRKRGPGSERLSRRLWPLSRRLTGSAAVACATGWLARTHVPPLATARR